MVWRCVKQGGGFGVRDAAPDSGQIIMPGRVWKEFLEVGGLGLLVNKQDLLVGFPTLRPLRNLGSFLRKALNFQFGR